MKLDVITPEGYVVRGAETDSVSVPTTEGLFGILRGHAPMAAILQTGVLRYHQDDGDHRVAVTGGYFEVVNDVITVLADAAELDVDIDVARARAALRRAEARLHAKQAGNDRARAEAALKRSLNRLKAAGANPRGAMDKDAGKGIDQ